MSASPHPRLDVSKVGLLIGVGLILFGAYTLFSYFRPGGHGHAMAMLRGAVAVPLGPVIIYLSFSTVCSACGATLTRRQLSTSAAQATAIMMGASTGDAAGLARAYVAARRDPGPAAVTVEACPSCRRLVRLSGGRQASRILANDTARPLADAVLAEPESP